ncbi:MAG: hypothetical protein EXQ56_12330 [Acidobacteria bacterium]|nr:hypothetical protein [Acidobacteriota bacterium]
MALSAAIGMILLSVIFFVNILRSGYDRETELLASTKQLRSQPNSSYSSQRIPEIPISQSFGGSLEKFNNSIGKDDWAVPLGTDNVVLDWDAVREYDAVADITVRTYTGNYGMQPELKTSVRLKMVPEGTIIETRDIANRDGIRRFALPRMVGRKQYQLEIKLYPEMQASVAGQIVFTRHQ